MSKRKAVSASRKGRLAGALAKAEKRTERARERLQRESRRENLHRDMFLASCGWERVRTGWSEQACWRSKSSGRVFTGYAAIREQRRRDKRNARRADREPVQGEGS